MRGLYLIGVIIWLIMPSDIFAQLKDLEVQPLDASNETIPVFRDYPDHAAIIVSSSLTNLQFDSNVEIVADLSEPNSGEYRLIIAPFRQSISVNSPGYKQIRFSVQVTNPRQVVFYNIEPLVDTEDLIPIVLSLNELDATVTIDNIAYDPNLAIRLEEGTYTIRIEKEGYRTIVEEIEIDEESFRFDYELEAIQPTTITYTSDPPEARLEINNVEIGETSLQEFRFPGTYFIRISKPGYKSIQQSITIVENLSNDPSLNKFHFRLEQSVGELNLTLNPPNSTVYLNRESYGSQSEIRVTPGTYLLEVEKSGYTGYSEPISIVEGDVITRTITLEQIVGSLRLTVQPISTRMRLINSDNETFREWDGAIILDNVPIGNYRLLGNADGFNNYAEEITIERDQIFGRNIEMIERTESDPPPTTTPPPPVTTPVTQPIDNSQVSNNIIDDSPDTFIQGYLGPPLQEEQSTTTPTIRTGSKGSLPIKIAVFPSQASIFINDNLVQVQGHLFDNSLEQTPVLRLEPGTYTVRVELDGYTTKNEEIRVTTQNTSFYFSLQTQ